MKYKVLKKCHAGGRICREGEIVSFQDAVDNKYLEAVSVKTPVAKKEKTPDQKPLSSLAQKPAPKTGMAATGKKKKGK